MSRSLARIALAFVVLAGVVLAGARLGGFAQNAQTDRGIVADLISRALSSDTSQVSIGAVEGALSSDVTIRDVVLSDRDGVWLRVDRVRLIWRRTALLLRRLEVDRLEIGRLEVLRRPLPQPGPAPANDAPILPELPLKVVITAFQLGELALGPDIAGGAPAQLTANGAATLGPPSEGLDLRLDARRTDQAGELSLRLGFVPQSTRLQIAARVNEPAGGLISSIADLPGRPPVQLSLDGDGPLDSFNSQLNFTAGETIGAQGSANLSREGALRRLALALDARIEGLMPAPVAPVFAGSTRLDGAVRFRDDGGIDLDRVALTSALARLDVAGRYGADQNLDLRITAGAVPNEGGKTVAAGTEIGKLALDTTIRGPLAGPRIVARLDLAQARLPQGSLESLQLAFDATPSGPMTEPGARVALVADGRARGVALADEGLRRLVGSEVDFTLRGSGDGQGEAEFETLKLALAGIEFDYTGQAGRARVLGQARAAIADLGRLSGLAGRPLRGSANVAADLDAVPRENRFAAMLSGEGKGIVTGIPALDRLLEGGQTLAGRVATNAAGELDVTGFRLGGQHVAVTADGRLSPEASDLRAALSVPQLRRADPRLTGRGEITAQLTGPQDRLDANARIAVTDATALGRPVPRLAIDAVLRDLQGALAAQATLDGMIEGKPATGSLQLARRADDGWDLSKLDIAIGSVRLGGAVSVDAQSRAAGKLTLAAPNLDDLSALALTRLGGRLDAEITLSTPDGRQDAAVVARAARLNAPNVAIERLDANLSALDLYGRPRIDGTVAVDRAVLAGEPVSAIRLNAKGGAQASALTLTATARGFNLNGAADLVAADPVRLDISRFEARRDGRRIALAGPASIAFPAEGVRIADLALAIDGGRLTVNGTAGEKLDLSVDARNVPLAAARLAVPSLDIAGTLNAQARVQGTPSALAGEWQVRIARLVARETRSAGLPALDVNASGRLNGSTTSVNATLAGGNAINLAVTGTAPLSADGALDLAAKGRLDAALANATLGASGQRVTGAIDVDMRATGSASAPRLAGGASLRNGTFTDALQGVRLTAVTARLVANGDNVTIENASARAANGGTLSASGRVRVDPQAGFPGEITLRGQRAQLVASGLVTAVADLDLVLSGALAQSPRVSGTVGIVSLDVAVPDRLPASLRPVDGTRHVRPSGTAAARLAARRKAESARRGRAAPAFDAQLAITVSAPNRVFIRGRGIDAELGGDLRVTGTSSAPVLNGGFELRRGRLQVLGQRLDFSRGRVTFADALTPELDFIAETRAGDVTARIGVSGPADQPAFAFTSQPDLPQDEVLSRILFARASGSLSPLQALQLAQAAAQFAGGGGDDSFERLRRSLGVDNLDIQMGASGGPTVGVSRYIGNNVSVGVKAGTKPEESGVSVGIDLTRRLKLQAETNADGSAAVGIGAEWEY